MQFPFWRKTRKPIPDTKYIGTDCNRNFDHHWNLASSRPSKHTYRGETPFSEPETEMLKTLMHSIKSTCKFYLSLHSYAKAFMYPFGYTKYVLGIKSPDSILISLSNSVGNHRIIGVNCTSWRRLVKLR